MKKSHLKTLIREIHTEVKKIQGEHRGAKGVNVGKTRSKHHPLGKSGEIAPRAGEEGSGISKEDIIKKYLGTVQKTDQLLDLLDYLNIKLPVTIDRFDTADIASFVLNHLYVEDPKTHVATPNEQEIGKAFDFLAGAGFINFNYLNKVKANDEHGDEELGMEPGETSSALEIDPENPPAPEAEEEPLPDPDFEEPSAEDDNEPTSKPIDQPQISEAARSKLKKLIKHLVNKSFKNEGEASPVVPVRTENVIQNSNLDSEDIKQVTTAAPQLEKLWKGMIKYQNDDKKSSDIANHMFALVSKMEASLKNIKDKISSELK
jgi:hypothetical protein